MISFIDQKNLLVAIGNILPKEIITYAIGGTAMTFLGFKEATIDIDLVFQNKEERTMFKEAAKSLGYREMDAIMVCGVKNNKPQMVSLGDARLDLFLSDVIDFTFSEQMKKRAVQTHQFGKNLTVKIADKHDIIVMKCATKRTKDEEDIVNIVKDSEIDWNSIIEEVKVQVSLGRELAFAEMGFLVERLLHKHRLKIPKSVYNMLTRLMKEQIDARNKKYE